jgi:hypothetical protein
MVECTELLRVQLQPESKFVSSGSEIEKKMGAGGTASTKEGRNE